MIRIPLCKPFLEFGEVRKGIEEVIDSGILTGGKYTERFERDFAEYIGVKYAVSLNSCTSALQLAVSTLCLKKVTVPSLTFSATVNSVINARAEPVFVDIDKHTYNISPEDLKIKIKKSRNIDGIMPVHFAGMSCRMDEIMEIAHDNNLKVIEDSAECVGGTFRNRKTGSFGDIGCFSFFPTKNITACEGGMITTNVKGIADEIRMMKEHGVVKSGWRRDAKVAGYNFRLTEVQAVIGMAQLRKLDRMNSMRRRHARYLIDELQELPIELPAGDRDCEHVYQMFIIKVRRGRNAIVERLNKAGIGASVHFDPPVHRQAFYKKYGAHLPVTDDVSKRVITLPMFPQLKKKEVERTITCLKKEFT